MMIRIRTTTATQSTNEKGSINNAGLSTHCFKIGKDLHVRRASHRYRLKYVYSVLGLLAVCSIYIIYKYPRLPIGYDGAKGA